MGEIITFDDLLKKKKKNPEDVVMKAPSRYAINVSQIDLVYWALIGCGLICLTACFFLYEIAYDVRSYCVSQNILYNEGQL